MHLPGRSDQVNRATDAWRRVRILAIGHQRGWFRYAAGDLNAGRHILDLGNGVLREVLRDEVEGWVFGVGAARGDVAALAAVGEPPALVSIPEAATILGMSEEGVSWRVNERHLYPLYLARERGGRERYLFAAQVQTQVEEGSDDAGWRAIEALLPPLAPVTKLRDWGGPRPSPDPLPIPPGGKSRDRWVRALMIGHQEGWFEYEHIDPRADVATATVATGNGDDRLRVTVPGEHILPWVLGHADVHGHPELVAYREGLG